MFTVNGERPSVELEPEMIIGRLDKWLKEFKNYISIYKANIKNFINEKWNYALNHNEIYWLNKKSIINSIIIETQKIYPFVEKFKISKNNELDEVIFDESLINYYACLDKYQFTNSGVMGDYSSYLGSAIKDDTFKTYGNYCLSLEKFIALLYLTSEGIFNADTKLIRDNRIVLINDKRCTEDKKMMYYEDMINTLSENIKRRFNKTDHNISYRFLPGETSQSSVDCIIIACDYE